MEKADNKLSFCTFNCRSLKSSVPEIYNLCCSYDMVFIQEHWLLPNELDLLNDIHYDFLAVGQSAVDISHGVLTGRPYGGTAILYRKSLISKITRIQLGNPRITAVILQTDIGPVLFVSAYMPCDYGNAECHENFIATCANITALFAECDALHLVVAGDFNCHYGSRFYDSFVVFANDNDLIFSDINRLTDAFTYCSDATSSCTWIDHVVCSRSVDALINKCFVLYDYVSSDHKPLLVVLNNLLQCDDLLPSLKTGSVGNLKAVPDWSKADDLCIVNYHSELDAELSYVTVPDMAALASFNYTERTEIVNNYYEAVVKSMKTAFTRCIPSRLMGSVQSEYVVPGWNEFVKDKHKIDRDAFLDWLHAGKPHDGPLRFWMTKTRAQFKMALRYCKQHEATITADLAADSLTNRDYDKFWKTVRKQNNAKATKLAHVIDGCCGDDAIAERWRDHFQKLYNRIDDSVSKNALHRLVCDSSQHADSINITISDILEACSKQKRGKAPGPDGIAMEAIIFGGQRLHIHLCLLFNLFVQLGYLPTMFMHSVMIPIVKNKCGDLSDLNNYRAIAISSALSKILETVLTMFLYSESDVDCFQFGFKPGHSTSVCTSSFKQTVDYYTSQGSHVFACFIDFSKAFDSVNYWKLFLKLMTDGVNYMIVNLLTFWYSNQSAAVRWGGSLSASFYFSNGLRQGGVLSPYLFTRYIRDLIRSVVVSAVGCMIGPQMVNLLAYADDLVLLAPSWRAMQHLLSVLYSEICSLDLTCNTKKSVSMVFMPKKRDKIICSDFPRFKIGDSDIQFVESFKYLGHFITSDLNDDDDIQREVQNMFFRTNILIRRFAHCSFRVKIVLFKSYCLGFYDIALWKTFTAAAFSKFQSCYNKCLKLFFRYRRRDSLTQLLLDTGLPSFSTVIHNCKQAFNILWFACNNSIVATLCDLL